MPAPGTRIGPYEIVAPLGAGGMGEVFRARDPRLGRDVAIKALPAVFAQDADRLLRFEREAKLLASLSHPNIAGLLGLEEAEGARYLVLEYVDGETLESALRRGPLPVSEAIDLARQVAAGVEAAHEAGVVHRDLKPGNVMLTASGGVKVLDFGLAKGGTGRGASGSDPQLSASPTMTYAATQAGMILGTAAYMSPEQARGKQVDRRTDIWSFGCVLFEMLTGRRAYEGETVSDMVARILERDPDWSALPAAVPPRLVALLRRCLIKDARQRVRDIGDVRLELEAIAAGDDGRAAAAAAGPAKRPVWLRPALALAGLAVGVLAGSMLLKPRPSGGLAATLTLQSPPGVAFGNQPSDIAVSPDGKLLVYVATDSLVGRRLWVRSLDRENSRPLVGTDGGDLPFWSPDARQIGFFSGDQLRTYDLATGSVRTLASAPLPRGGTWGKDVILYQPVSLGPLWSVSAAGGSPKVATTVDSANGDRGHRFPQFLPDGRRFIMTVLGKGDTRIVGGEVGKPAVREMFRTSGWTGANVAGDSWLLAPRDGQLVAQRFDPRTFALRGEAILLPGLHPIATYANGGQVLSASFNGVIVQRGAVELPQRLSLVDRQGRSVFDIPTPPRTYVRGSLSPDGRMAALESITGSNGATAIWTVDLVRGDVQPLTSAGVVTTPVHSPDGRRLAVVAETESGTQDFWLVDVNDPASLRPARRMPSVFQSALAWAPDGSGVVLRTQGTTTRQDLIFAPVDSTLPLRTLRATNANEPVGSISPDGRWLAYASDESGRMEVRIVSFARPEGISQIVSRGAFAEPAAQSRVGLPMWRRDGRELLYVAADSRTLMSIAVTPGETPEFGEPQPLFRLSSAVADLCASPGLDRFLLSITRDEEGRSTAAVVIDWMRLVEKAK